MIEHNNKLPDTIGDTAHSFQQLPNQEIKDLGTGLGVVYEPRAAKAAERSAMWAEQITPQAAIIYSRRLSYYHSIGPLLQKITEGVCIQRKNNTGETVHPDERIRIQQTLEQLLYSNRIIDLPHDVLPDNHQISLDLYDVQEVNHFGKLLQDHKRTIDEAWKQIEESPVPSPKERGRLAYKTAKSIIDGKTDPSVIQRLLGYSSDDILRLSLVSARTLAANTALVLSSDQITTWIGILVGKFVDFNGLPTDFKVPLTIAVGTNYYDQLRRTIRSSRQAMKKDPEVAVSYSGYTAHMILEKLLTESEEKYKEMPFLRAYLFLNPLELLKELIWDTGTSIDALVSDTGPMTRLAGDSAGIIFLLAQRYGLIPHMDTAWKKGESIFKDPGEIMNKIQTLGLSAVALMATRNRIRSPKSNSGGPSINNPITTHQGIVDGINTQTEHGAAD